MGCTRKRTKRDRPARQAALAGALMSAFALVLAPAAHAQADEAREFLVGSWHAQGTEPTLQAEVNAVYRFDAGGRFSSNLTTSSGGARMATALEGTWSAEVTPEGLIHLTLVVESANGSSVRLRRRQSYEVVDDDTMRPEDDWREVSVLRRTAR